MVATRPLLYFSLPGLALIIGFIFLRRQKRSSSPTPDEKRERDRNDEINENHNKSVTFNNDDDDDEILKKKNQNRTEKAISIKLNNSSCNNNNSEFESNLGKSAPINITQGMKSFKTNYIDDDDDIHLNTGMNYQHRHSNSMSFVRSFDKEDDEFYLSSVDLPDSPNCNNLCKIRNNHRKSIEEPIIIKATVNPNISLSSSFIENKYTEESEEIISSISQNQQKEQQQQNQLENVLNNNDDDDANNNNITSEAMTKSVNDSNNLSPPSSEFSAHSGDSGKGSSLPHSDRLKITNYDFILPTSLIGQLCGRKRTHINQIKTKSGANIILKSHSSTNRMKICSIKGTEKEINSALSLIRARFPLKRYPHLTLQKIEYAEPQSIVQLSLDYTSCLQLRLIEGINNDVIVVSVLSGNQFFVHHPSHPSYRSISILHECMNKSYETGDAPLLPEITENAICVAKIGYLWYRVQIVSKNLKEQNCVVKFLDYGGYTLINIEYLRQIRSDFMTIPFQATECILSNVEPIGSEWTQEAIETLCHLTAGLTLQAQIVRYNSSNIPEINLYAPLSKNNVIFINKEMIARGFAK